MKSRRLSGMAGLPFKECSSEQHLVGAERSRSISTGGVPPAASVMAMKRLPSAAAASKAGRWGEAGQVQRRWGRRVSTVA
jgi:hypothetical protein